MRWKSGGNIVPLLAKVSFIVSIFTGIIVLIFLTGISAYASDRPAVPTFLEMEMGKTEIVVDGIRGAVLNVAPSTVTDSNGNQVPMIPLRSVAEMLGYEVEWQEESQITVVTGYRRTIKLDASGQIAFNGETVPEVRLLQQMSNENLLIEASFFQKYCACTVIWDEVNQILTVAAFSPDSRSAGLDQMNDYLMETGRAENGVTVAVIDTGVDCAHPYLRNRIVRPFDFTTQQPFVMDEIGHGTHVAGIIANCTPETVKIMPLKVATNSSGSIDQVASAIRYAVQNGAKVINISLVAAAKDSQELANAVNAAVNSGCVVVAAAGNERNDTKHYSPAGLENAIVVTAVDRQNQVLSSSNYGDTITVAAPGLNIVSTLSGGGYDQKEGTSVAAPFVSAGVAMLKMHISDILPSEIKNLLEEYSVGRKTALKDPQYGYGVFNLEKYVADSRAGKAKIYAENRQERVAGLDQEVLEIKQRVKRERPGDDMLIRTFYAAELINDALTYYQRHDYFRAGYYLEQAVAIGDAARGVGRNNLAFMLRRGEYVSYNYDARSLLSESIARGQPLAYINMALLEVAQHEWEQADKLMRECCAGLSEKELEEVIHTWSALERLGDPEGNLVMAWLIRFQKYAQPAASQRTHLDLAHSQYPDIPDWLYEVYEL